MTDPNLELMRKIGTPTRLGVTIGQEYMGVEYVPYDWILEVERRVLLAIQRPGRSFIILNVPPQNGKTTTFGMLLAAWYLGFWPHRQVIFIAYSEEYAASWGLKTRNLLQRYGHLFGEAVSSQADSKTNWKMANGFGGMISVGITGGITGNPGHLIIIDDVIKTMEDAASITAKAKHLDEYDGAISSRFQENTVVLVTATRFAEDDLSGRLIERQNEPGYAGDRFEVISIPALATPPDDITLTDDELAEWSDFLGRHEGEGLEGRYSQGFYESRRDTLPNFIWSAVYQQDPATREGGMFPPSKWAYWNIADPTRPSITRTVRVWDLATTEGGGDWTVGSKWGLGSNGDLYLLERERFRKSSADVEFEVLAAARRDGVMCKIIIEQERQGSGKAVVSHYKRILPGYIVDAAKAEGSKEQRATPYSIYQNQGRCHLPAHEKQLCKEWVDEHRKMMGDGRKPRHDDQIDTGAYAALDLMGVSGIALFVPGEDQLMDGNGEALSQDSFEAVLLGENRFFAHANE